MVWRMIGSKEEARTEIDRRLQFFPQLTKAMVADAGHMLHHDQPQILADLVERFLTE